MPERPFGGGGVPPEGVYTLPSLAKRGGELRDHSFPAPLSLQQQKLASPRTSRNLLQSLYLSQKMDACVAGYDMSATRY
jgi:hypothetical protein